MRRSFVFLLVLVGAGCPTYAQTFEDEFVQGLFRYLASRWDVNHLPYQGGGSAELGTAYYVERPKCHDTLQKWAQKGKTGPPLHLYDTGVDLSDVVVLMDEETLALDSVRIKKIGGFLELPGQRGGFGALRNALLSAGVRIRVGRAVTPWGEATRRLEAAKAKLLQHGLPTGATGIVVPTQLAVVLSFEYESENSSVSSGGARLDLESVKASKAEESRSRAAIASCPP